MKRFLAMLGCAVLLAIGWVVVFQWGKASADPACVSEPDIRTGYYLGNNANPSATIKSGNLESVTQYRSMADGSVWPGYQSWTPTLPDGTEISYAVEFKHYGAAVGTQTVNGKVVPAPSMHIQRRSGTTFPLAYGYGQLLSGDLDPLLDRMKTQIGALAAARSGLKINWQIASEFDTDHEFGTDEAGVEYTWAQSDARAVKAIAYLINYLRDNGLPDKVTFTVGMAGIWRDSWKRMHPPSLAWIVDGGLQYNAYNHSTPGRLPYAVLNMTKAWSVADLSAKWNSLPIVIEEWGTPASQGSQAEWLDKVPAAIAQMNSEPGPKVSRMNYFDSNPPWGTFNPRAEGEAAWVKWSQDPINEPCQPLPSASPSPSPVPSSPEPSPTPSVTLPPTPSVQPSTSESDEPGGCS